MDRRIYRALSDWLGLVELERFYSRGGMSGFRGGCTVRGRLEDCQREGLAVFKALSGLS